MTEQLKTLLDRMKPVPVARLDVNNTLNQIYSTGWEVCFVSKNKEGEFQQVNQLAFCKDYLNDVYWAHTNKTSMSCFGMSYDSQKHPPVQDDALIVMATNKTIKNPVVALKKFRHSAMLLRAIERKAGLKPTRMRLADFDGNAREAPIYVLYEADPTWLHASPLLSLYTCLLRMGTEYLPSFDVVEYVKGMLVQPPVNDFSYVRTLDLDTFVKKNKSLFEKDIKKNYPKDTPILNIHGLGIRAWIGSNTMAASKDEKTFQPPVGKSTKPTWFTLK